MTDPPADPALVQAVDEGERLLLVDVTRRTPGARIEERDGLLLAIGAVPAPFIVNTIVTTTSGVAIDAVARAVAVYQELGHEVGIWTADHADQGLESGLADLGFSRLASLTGMALRDAPPAEDPPAGAVLRTVVSERDRARWLEADLAGFAGDDEDRSAIRSTFSTLGSLVGGPISTSYAEVDGRPVAAALAVVDPATGVGGVGWVGSRRIRATEAAVSGGQSRSP